MKKSIIIKVIIMIIGVVSLSGCTMNEAVKSIPYVIQTENNYDVDKYYMNPPNINLIADPFVLQDKEGAYYAYGTSDKIGASGYLTWRSEDLINWEEVGVCYMSGRDGWAKSDFWAPEVYFYNDAYYMFYTARSRETNYLGIGVAKSDSPKGPFIDIIDKPLLEELNYPIIDANLIFGEDGRIYLYFVRDCSGNIIDGRNESHIYGIELASDMVTTIGEPVKLLDPNQEWEYEGDWRWNEGPFVIRDRGKYYMMYSANLYSTKEYSVGYAIAEYPLGPYEKVEHNPILYADKEMRNISGPGHNSVVKSPSGKELYCVYHTHMYPDSPNHKRQINIDKMGIAEDGRLYINGPTSTPQPLPDGIGAFMTLNKKIQTLKVKKGNGDNIEVINDGKVILHQSDKNQALKIDESTTLNIQLDQEYIVTDILLYGIPDTPQEMLFKIVMNDGSQIDNFPPKILKAGEAIIISFEERLIHEIDIVLKDLPNAYLSEIIILGREKT